VSGRGENRGEGRERIDRGGKGENRWGRRRRERRGGGEREEQGGGERGKGKGPLTSSLKSFTELLSSSCREKRSMVCKDSCVE
jgi:hypothetical protein